MFNLKYEANGKILSHKIYEFIKTCIKRVLISSIFVSWSDVATEVSFQKGGLWNF